MYNAFNDLDEVLKRTPIKTPTDGTKRGALMYTRGRVSKASKSKKQI